MTGPDVGAGRPYRGLGACPVCGGPGDESLFAAERVPVLCNALFDTEAEAARAPLASIDLVLCGSCGLVWNAAFDESMVTYSPAYENSLHFSPRFRDYAGGLAADLVRRHGLDGRTVAEIGSGNGDFLALLCDAGAARGIGYDPSHGGDTPLRPGLEFVPTLFPEDSAPDADFFCARHVFEHLSEPAHVLRSIRDSIPAGRDVGLYLEVPDGTFLLRETAVWDVIYEHPLHFTAPAMARLLGDAGFTLTRLATAFGGQYLCAEGSTHGPGATPPDAAPTVEALATLAADFAAHAAAVRAAWDDRLHRLRAAGATVVLWGAGSKGVTFLATVPQAAHLAAVVDVNPRKQGRYLPVSARRVVEPAELCAVRPDAVVLLNPVYRDEVARMLAGAGLRAELLTAPAP